MAKKGGCPYCDVYVKPENLASHLRKAHAKEEEADALDRSTRKARPRGRARPGRGFPVWGAVFAAILVLAVGMVIILPNLIEPGPLPPVDEMCVQHAGLGVHNHVQLQINILGGPYSIPAEIGIVSDTCFRPIHTHENNGVIHIELPAPRPVTLGDFFGIWGQPLSPTQILTYSVDATHELGMSVNGVESTAFADLVLIDGQTIVLDYHTL